MQIEITMALNFVISYLYNKLPRRRVNLFGEELEKALKDHFQGHWYPETPEKGSAFRCLKTGEPTDAVLDQAARECGVSITDILENLPAEMSVWVDPGEVSYRIGEKGVVKILYKNTHCSNSKFDKGDNEREAIKTFNPDAPCFRPIDSVGNSMSAMSLSPKRSPNGSPMNGVGVCLLPNGTGPPMMYGNVQPHSNHHGHHSQNSQSHHSHHHHMQQQHSHNLNHQHGHNGAGKSGGLLIPVGAVAGSAMSKQMMPTSPVNAQTTPFMPRSQQPLTFTTATFAQTKFGSTKLKTSTKRSNGNALTALSIPRNRSSPTEFHNFPRRSMHQLTPPHQYGSQSHSGHALGPIGSISPARSISPNVLSASISNHSPDPFYFGNNGGSLGSTSSPMASMYSPSYLCNNIQSRNMFDGAFDGAFGKNNNLNRFQSTTAGSFNMDAPSFYNMNTFNINNMASNNDNPLGIGASLPLPIGTQDDKQKSSSPSPSMTPPCGVEPTTPNNNKTTDTDGSTLLDGLNAFYASSSPYQHLLVAN